MRPSRVILLLLAIIAPVWSQAQNRDRLTINSHWNQVIITTNAGSRSEGYTSYLHYMNESMTPWIETILIGSDRFDFVSGDNPWDFKGYDQTFDNIQYSTGRYLFGTTDLTRVWYEGTAETRKIGTPDEWIWASRGDLELFIDPERIRAAADAYQLSRL